MKNIAIISGGASGLGLELVKIMHNKGYFVCNLDKDQQALDKIDKQFPSNYKSFLGNIADENFVKSTIQEIAKMGNIVALL